MSDRTLAQRVEEWGHATWPEYQDEALIAGYNSVTEYMLAKHDLVLQEVMQRLGALEGQHSEGQRVELRGDDEH